jgi:hypothetical protein
MRPTGASEMAGSGRVVEVGQVELAQPCGIHEQIDLDDLAVRDREAGHAERPAISNHDEPRHPVNQRRPHVGGETREGDASLGDGDGATHLPRGAPRPRAAVDAEHDVGVEHRDQRVEGSVARSGEEGVDQLSLAGKIDVRHRGALHPASCAARELPCRGGCAPDQRSDLVERDGEHVVQHEREPLGRRQRLEHDEQREPDRVGEQRFVLGVDASSALTIGSGTWASSGSSRRDCASAACPGTLVRRRS